MYMSCVCQWMTLKMLRTSPHVALVGTPPAPTGQFSFSPLSSMGRELLWDSIRGTPRGWAGSGAWTLPLQPGEPADFGFSLHHVLGLRDPVSHFCVRNTKRMDAGRQPACRVWQVWGLLMMMEHPCDLVPCGEMGQGLFSTCWSFFIVQYQEKIPLPAYLWPPTLGFFWRIF